MQSFRFATHSWPIAAFAAVCLVAVHAQNSPTIPAKPGTDAAAPAQAQAAGQANDEILAKAARLYYSTAKNGLTSFDCSAQADWPTLFRSANNGTITAADETKIGLLNAVKVTLHARMQGGSTLDWTPPADPAKPLDAETSITLGTMHEAAEQTLQGFMQFWAPFVDGSVVPANSDGLEMTKSADGFRMHADQGGTDVTEILGADLVLRHFNVRMENTTVEFAPSYKSTADGLLVSAFVAHILAVGAPPNKAQEMHVGIEYQTVEGIPIPQKINMEVIGSGTFNFVLNGCKVIRKPK
jgi:hypothetical protein